MRYFRWLLAGVIIGPLTMTAASLAEPDRRETVILLHGLGLGRWAMWPIEQRLKRDGYRVLSFTYPSRTVPLEKLGAEWLPARLRENGVENAPRLHFVTHSMGGILLRCWIRAGNRPENLGRIVMLAPPNAGSEVVDNLRKKFPPFRWVMSVNGARLGTGTDSVPRSLGRWPAEVGTLGILAGDRTFNPLFSHWLGDANDGKVRVASARLEGMADFRVLHHSHTWLQWRSETANEIRAFLREGKFSGEPALPRLSSAGVAAAARSRA